MTEPVEYTPEQVSALFNIEASRIAEMCRQGRFGYKQGRFWHIPADEVEKVHNELIQDPLSKLYRFKDMPLEELAEYTIIQAAAKLNINKRRVRLLCSQGRMGHKQGQTWVILPDELERVRAETAKHPNSRQCRAKVVATSTKRCSRCKEWKPFSEFGKSSRRTNGLNCYCKVCIAKYSKSHYATHHEYYRQYANSHSEEQYRLKIRGLYNISAKEYEDILIAQGGVCAICHRPPNGKRLSIDHAHDETGTIRGLLCSQCNVAIGMANDDPNRLRQMAEYLERFNPPNNAPLPNS